MTKFILDKDVPLEWDDVFDALIKEWEKNLKNFKDAWLEQISKNDEFLINEALSMPCFDVSTEVFEVMKEWVKENGTPYVDDTEQLYLDENNNLQTEEEMMKKIK